MPNDREDPRDANPMFKRLPAEVVSRRRPQAMQQESMQVVAASVDLEQVLQRKPEGRAKWLAKALQQAQDGRLEVQSLYDIVSCQRFCEDLTDKVGRKMYRALHASSEVFSSKQRKILQKDCPLAQLYSATAWGEKDGDAEETSKAEAQANLMEDMMARCRDFVRFKQTERGERSSSTRSRSGRSRIRSSSSCSRSGRQRERTGADRKAPSGRKRGSSSSSSGESHRRSKTKTAKRKDRGSSSSASLRHDRKRRKK